MNDQGSSHGAIVTGAGSGVGRAVALLLAESGFDLALVGRRVETLEATAAEAQQAHPERVIRCVQADLSRDDAAAEIVSSARKTLPRIDTLVNNAGVAPLLPIEESDAEVLSSAFETNALGPGRLISALWPILVDQRAGCIVNVSSMATQDPFPGFFAYAASKAAVNLFAASCAKEGAEYGIRAFSVAPGAIETDMLRALFDESLLPASACLAPEDVARVVVACVKGERDEDNGRTIWLPSPS